MSVRSITLWGALACCMAGFPVVAQQPLSTLELTRHCAALVEGGSGDGRYCLVLLQGYLAGADMGDDGHGGTIGLRRSHPEETFGERAARTRLGLAHRRNRDPGGPCIGSELGLVQVALEIAPYIAAGDDGAGLSPTELMHRALLHNFPCQP